VADANHVLLFNGGQGYQVSHPASGGDACLSLSIAQPLLRELAPAALLQPRDEPVFRGQSLRIDERAQVLVALLRHNLRHGGIEPLEAESLALTLACRSLGPRTAHAPGATRARQRLVDRAKQVEGLPLYRYHLRLRLAHALDRIADCEDVAALALDLGFSSHSHFSAAFRQAYGRTPSEFREAALAPRR
jgi:hypothetical protein